jgi:uncharacterized protein (DUF1697 family)
MPMADLRNLVTGLGFSDVRTLLQSGNLVFRGLGAAEAIEARLEVESQKRFGFHADYLVRDLDEWDAMIAANPFVDAARDDPGHLLVMSLRTPVAAGGLAKLREAIKGRETVEAVGRAAYIIYPDGIGSSKLTIQVIERHLGSRGTGRNWNTVLKLAALARA